MDTFLSHYHESAVTSLGLFWMAFWAFGLGYLISSMIQVFVTQERMKQSMGESGPKSVALGTFFGFISSSCSFAALATTRALFTKGAGLIPALAFLLASTNLVVELGIIIAAFLSWQFVVGEYVGGIMLILLMWLVVKLTLPKTLEDRARDHAQEQTGKGGDGDVPNWKTLIRSKEGWRKVSSRYIMEWAMVWKDVTIGFTVAGIIAAFVPRTFFQTLFVGSGSADPGFWNILLQTLVGPLAAFFTFIGSMGNIPLAAVLFSNGVSFAGIIAFIFSDLVVFPVLRIQAQYYGWAMALYILGVFLTVLIAAALLMHYGFAVLDMLPDSSSAKNVTEREFFKVDYTLFLNVGFLVMSVGFLGWNRQQSNGHEKEEASLGDKALFGLAMTAFLWLGGGLLTGLVI
ncbi:MAG: membrane protein [Nitrospirales bacterium]|nr:MAG: membrane protein [Nitrospirales bacterium]